MNKDKADYQSATTALFNALRQGRFITFRRLLADHVILTIYRKRTIEGKHELIKYFRGWRRRHVIFGLDRHMEIKFSFRFCRECLVIEDDTVILLLMKNGRISQLAIVPLQSFGNNPYTNILSLPPKVEKVCPGMQKITGKPLNTPCLFCGKPSDKLEMYNVSFDNDGKRAIGWISVCPDCGKVVELWQEKQEEYSEKPYNPEIMSGNVPNISRAGHSFEYNVFARKAMDFQLALAGGRADWLQHIDAVTTDGGFELIIKPAEMAGNGDTASVMVMGRNEDYIELEGNLTVCGSIGMAAWQVYLLKSAGSLLPAFWHGGYSKCKYLFCKDDMMKIGPLKYADCDGIPAEYLEPAVVVKGNCKVTTAEVYCCLWSDWAGLVRECTRVVFENGRLKSVSNNLLEREKLFPYDCGVRF